VDVELWVWAAFVAFILAMVALDLFVIHRDAHEVSFREAALTSLFWVAMGLAFAGVLWWWQGAHAAGGYLAGYLIEKSLAVDNIFVFALILTYFSVQARDQHRVLYWGVIGALVFRAMFIVAGAVLLSRFHWTVYLFGGFLVFTGIRMARHRDVKLDPQRNPVLKLFRRAVPMTEGYEGSHYFVRRAGRVLATPMLAVLVVIATSDVVFAVDSIPAIFAVTREPFLVFSSNAFAVLGLRAMYFMLAGMMKRFVHLSIGLSVVLVFVGLKMLLTDVFLIPIWASLSVIAVTIGVSIATSLRATSGAAEQSGRIESLSTAEKDGSAHRRLAGQRRQ
jgi:TerC family integral membrane protein